MKKIAIIGLGHWGPNYVRNFYSLPDIELKYICDKDQAQVDKVRKAFPAVKGVNDYRELLADDELDAAVVATPAVHHFNIIRDLLNAGKHILAEKPLTLKAAESKELTDLAEQKKCLLMVGHTFLYNSGVKKIKKYIDDGEIGRIYYMNATRTHLGLIRDDVNAIWDLAPHDVSIFNFLTGSLPVAVSAVGSCYLKDDREDVGFINLRYPDDIVANIHVSWTDSNKERTIRVVGSKARVTFDDIDNLEKVKLYQKGIAINIHNEAEDFGNYQLVLRDGDIVSPRIEGSEPLKEQCQHFCHCLNEGQTPFTDGNNGYEVVKVMEAIEQSIRDNGRLVEIN